MTDNEYFHMSLVGDDIESVVTVVNQGIDARLTGFTESSFEWNQTPYCLRLECNIAISELEILIRRLNDLDEWGAPGQLADSIVLVQYGHETI